MSNNWQSLKLISAAWSTYFDFDVSSKVNSAVDSMSSAVGGVSNMINGQS